MKRTAALLLCLLLLSATMLPAMPWRSAAALPADESEAVGRLLDFSARLHEMRERCSGSVMKGSPDDPYNTARLIVKSEGEVDASGAIAGTEGTNGRIVLQYRTPGEAERAAERLRADPRVKYAVPDTEHRAEPFAACAAPMEGTGFNSWGYGEDQVGMAALQERVLAKYGGDPASLPAVTVAVCDSGVNSGHEFLAGRMVAGYDFVNNDSDPSDGYGHGTFCAGVIADGAMPNVGIMPLKCISDSGYFSTSDVVNAIEYAYLHGCAAANLSLIEYNPAVEPLYEEAVVSATNAGMVCCVASGNWSSNASIFVPGKIERSFTVAAHDPAHAMWPPSNVGDCVDITAPGVDIYSTTYTGGYAVDSGTSFAAPHAAACCAVIKTYDPSLGPDEIMDLLKANAVDEGYTGGGSGRLYVGSLFGGDTPGRVKGDVDGDGSITSVDALMALRYALGAIALDDESAWAADYDSQSGVNSVDALLILRSALGL